MKILSWLNSSLFIVLLSGFLALPALVQSVDEKKVTQHTDIRPPAKPVEVESLRGPTAIPEESTPPMLKNYPKERTRPDLQYIGQPPLIPHSIRGYEITAKSNKCLMCHSWENAVTMNATRISITHFMDRDGKVLADVSPTRYFCTQCHVPQVNARPLIPSDFKPVESLKKP